jgi:hypothetical protein
MKGRRRRREVEWEAKIPPPWSRRCGVSRAAPRRGLSAQRGAHFAARAYFGGLAVPGGPGRKIIPARATSGAILGFHHNYRRLLTYDSCGAQHEIRRVGFESATFKGAFFKNVQRRRLLSEFPNDFSCHNTMDGGFLDRLRRPVNHSEYGVNEANAQGNSTIRVTTVGTKSKRSRGNRPNRKTIGSAVH